MRLFYEPFTSLEVFLPESLLDQIDLKTGAPSLLSAHSSMKRYSTKRPYVEISNSVYNDVDSGPTGGGTG